MRDLIRFIGQVAVVRRPRGKLSIEQVDLAGRRVFLRVDFKCRSRAARVTDDTRHPRVAADDPPLRSSGGRRWSSPRTSGRPKGGPDPKYSLAPVATRLAELLGRPVPLAAGLRRAARSRRLAHALEPGQILMLENLRFHPEEEKQRRRPSRARLAGLAEVYVNDAFAAAHRAHASIAAITRYLQPAAAGLLMATRARGARPHPRNAGAPVWAVLGGAKVSDKIELVDNLLGKVDALLIGGGMAFTFLPRSGTTSASRSSRRIGSRRARGPRWSGRGAPASAACCPSTWWSPPGSKRPPGVARCASARSRPT